MFSLLLCFGRRVGSRSCVEVYDLHLLGLNKFKKYEMVQNSNLGFKFCFSSKRKRFSQNHSSTVVFLYPRGHFNITLNYRFLDPKTPLWWNLHRFSHVKPCVVTKSPIIINRASPKTFLSWRTFFNINSSGIIFYQLSSHPTQKNSIQCRIWLSCLKI